MSVLINHAILGASDKLGSARFFCDLFDLAEPEEAGPFAVARAAARHGELAIRSFRHADRSTRTDSTTGPTAPSQRASTTTTARGVYFLDPGNYLEAITAPYAD